MQQQAPEAQTAQAKNPRAKPNTFSAAHASKSPLRKKQLKPPLKTTEGCPSRAHEKFKQAETSKEKEFEIEA